MAVRPGGNLMWRPADLGEFGERERRTNRRGWDAVGGTATMSESAVVGGEHDGGRGVDRDDK